jgi:hypothetical protein
MIEQRAPAGQNISEAIVLAVALSAENAGELVGFDFNGIKVRVDQDSNTWLIMRDWQRAIEGCVPDKIVGPHPAAELSDREEALDAKIRAENTLRQKATAEKRARQQAAKQATLSAALSVSPPIAFFDTEEWRKAVESNQDPYGKAAVMFAENWARLMQARMADGAPVADVAKECSWVAAIDITGFQYGCAVALLSRCWVHGGNLRRWHNLDTQIGDEGKRANASGGVLNPALLSIG